MSSISRQGNAQMKLRSKGVKPQELEELEDIGVALLKAKEPGVAGVDRVPLHLRQVKSRTFGTITWLGKMSFELKTAFSTDVLRIDAADLHEDLRREARALMKTVNGLLKYDEIPLDQRRVELKVRGVDYTLALVAPGLVCMDAVKNGRSTNNVHVKPFEPMAAALPDEVVAAYDALTRQIAKLLTNPI